MTNEEREALIAQGWTPPVAVDPDIGEANAVVNRMRQPFDLRFLGDAYRVGLAALKRGRELERAEAKPGMVWVKHDFATAQRHPARSQQMVCVEYSSGSFAADFGANIYWPNVTHYAIITPPEDK